MLVNPNPKHDWHIGTTIYCQHPLYPYKISSGVIWELDSEINMRPMARLAGISAFGDVRLELNQLFETRESAEDALKKQNAAETEMLVNQIKDVNDLVRFGYEHDIKSSPETFKTAYRIRAKELLGLNL